MIRMILPIVALVLAGTFPSVAADEPWFDTEHCAFCKSLAAQPGLLDHMKTEYHDTRTGIMSVTYIDKEYEAAFAKAQQGMQTAVADKLAGKPVATCKHCAALGEFYGMGLMPEQIKSEKCTIYIWSSADPAVVEKLQDFAKKSNEAMAEIRKKKATASAVKPNVKDGTALTRDPWGQPYLAEVTVRRPGN